MGKFKNLHKLIKNNTLQLSDVSESIDNLNKSDVSVKPKYSDVTLANVATNNTHKESNPKLTLANLATTKPHNVSFKPVTVTSTNPTNTQTTHVHHVPSQVPHVPPPTQETPKTNQETEQLKIDLKKPGEQLGFHL